MFSKIERCVGLSRYLFIQNEVIFKLAIISLGVQKILWKKFFSYAKKNIVMTNTVIQYKKIT